MPLTTEEWSFLSDGTPLDNTNYKCTITCTDLGISLVANLPQEFMLDIGAHYEEAFSQAIGNLPIVSRIVPTMRALGVQLTTQALTAQIWQGSTELNFSIPLVFQVEDSAEKDIYTNLKALYQLVLPGESASGGFLTAPGPRLDAEAIVKSIAAVASGVKNSPLAATKEIAGELQNQVQGIAGQFGPGLSSFVGKVFDSGKSLVSSVVGSAGNPLSTATGAQAIERAAGFDGNGSKPSLISAIKNNISLTLGNYMKFESVVITNVNQTHYVQPLEDGTMSRVEVTVSFKTFFVPTKNDIDKIFFRSKPSKGSNANLSSGSTALPGASTGAATDQPPPSGSSDSGAPVASNPDTPPNSPATAAPDTAKTQTADEQYAANVAAGEAMQQKEQNEVLAKNPGSTIDPGTGNVLNADSSVNVEASRELARKRQGL